MLEDGDIRASCCPESSFFLMFRTSEANERGKNVISIYEKNIFGLSKRYSCTSLPNHVDIHTSLPKIMRVSEASARKKKTLNYL